MAPAKPKVCTVDQDLLDSLISSLSSLRDGLSSTDLQGKSNTSTTDISSDTSDLNGILNALLQAVKAHAEQLAVQKSNSSNMEQRIRSQEDELDEHKQRGFKGNLIISSQHFPNSRKSTLIKSDEELKKEGVNLTSHVVNLVKTKYNVDLPLADIQACHRVNNSILLRIWNRKEGSAWSKINEGIKSGTNRDINVYFNYQLTSRRSSLLYEVRQLKKENKISNFYTDENGHIQIRRQLGGRKYKLTYYAAPNCKPKTVNSAELANLVKEIN